MKALSLIAIAVFLTLPAAAVNTPPMPMVVSVTVAETAYVSWIPDPTTADGATFNVYGFSGETAVLLATVSFPSVHASVPASYEFYGVSTISSGEESSINTSCERVAVSALPPEVHVHLCESSPMGVTVRLPP